jgi:adenylate kinase family enzyme
MSVKLFILGRPGSGKSTASHHIATTAWNKGRFVLRLRDYEILLRMFQADDGKEKFRAREHGGFDVRDLSELDTALEELKERIRLHLPLEKRHVLLIEFARANYSKAFELFSAELLRDAYFLFIETDVETCIQRIRERVAHPLSADDFFVSEDILRGYYGEESRAYVASGLQRDFGITKQIEIIDNMGSQREFLENVRRFAEQILDQEM